MEVIIFLTGWILWLTIIIPISAGTAVTYFAVSKALSWDEQHKDHCNSRIRQTIKGAIVGMTISGLITIIRTFY